MKTTPVTTDDISRSVWAVPPLALDANLNAEPTANGTLMQHIEAGGVSTLLYGANANVANLPTSAYEDVFTSLAETAGEDSWVIPSAGPDYGKLYDCTPALARMKFPAVMVLPNNDLSLPAGIVAAVRDFVQRAGIPAILYMRRQDYLPADQIASMFKDGTIVAIKYGVPPVDDDAYLISLKDAVGADRIVSGMGEHNGIKHMFDYGVGGFTAGVVCLAPARSMAILRAIHAGDRPRAEMLEGPLAALEDIRNRVSPVAVLHEAIKLSGLADMGAMLPVMAPLSDAQRQEIEPAARAMLDLLAEPAEAAE